jgi:long-subunit fatty acid transport protein
MGNSYIGLSEDASASYFNPAGLALLKKLEVSGGIDYSHFNNTTTFFNDVTEHSNSSTRLNRLSFVFPFPTYKGSLVFGLAYHTVSDLTGAMQFSGYNPNSSIVEDIVTYDPDLTYELYLSDANDNPLLNGDLQQSGDVLRSGSINNWSFSGAIEVYRNVFVGATLNIITGSYESTNDYFEDDIDDVYSGAIDPGDPNSPEDFLYFEENRYYEWDINGVDGKVGMLYQFIPQARFGMTIQFPKYYNIQERFDYRATSYFNIPNDSGYSNFRYNYGDEVEFDVITPFTFAAGFSGNLKGLVLNAEATIIDYSQTEFEDGYGISEAYLADVNKDIKEILRTVFCYNFGLEYNVPMTGLRLRTGYFVQPSPYEGDDASFDRKYITAGLGFLIDDAIALDAGYAYGWWNDYGDNYGSGESRTYQEINYNKFIFSASFRF